MPLIKATNPSNPAAAPSSITAPTPITLNRDSLLMSLHKSKGGVCVCVCVLGGGGQFPHHCQTAPSSITAPTPNTLNRDTEGWGGGWEGGGGSGGGPPGGPPGGGAEGAGGVLEGSVFPSLVPGRGHHSHQTPNTLNKARLLMSLQSLGGRGGVGGGVMGEGGGVRSHIIVPGRGSIEPRHQHPTR